MLIPEYVLLAKQAIYDRDKNNVAHELLFRSPLNLSASDIGSDIATRQVLLNYCASVTQCADASGAPVFINIDSQFLQSHSSLPVMPECIVIELTGSPEVTESLLSAVNRWRALGFRFALDGFDFSDRWQALLPLLDFIKVDTLSVDRECIAGKFDQLKHDGGQWVAERIEDEATFEFCKNIGFDFFQGYFLAKPESVLGSAIRPGMTTTIRIIKELDQPDITVDQISELVGQDPKLAMQMLKIINSSMFSLPKPVDDLKSAVVYLGFDKLRQWAMMIAFLSNGDVHIEACKIVLQRAKACELWCKQSPVQDKNASAAFLAGLVSGVDVLLNMNVQIFLEQVSLSASVRQAVLEQRGELGKVLQDICGLEYTVSQKPESLQQYTDNMLAIFQQASDWSSEVISELRA